MSVKKAITMVRTVNHESRKKAILCATINRYIEEPKPIASDDIAEEFSLSPATIRNIFSELEEDGFLTHPYTSAGRVPTGRGYRYYVDFLFSQLPVYRPSGELAIGERRRIDNEYKKEINRLEDALEKTSEVVSTITHYTSIVSFLDQQDKFFYKGVGFILEQPEFRDLKRMRFIIRMIEEREELLALINRDFEGKVKIYIGPELGYPEINNCSLAVSRYSVKKQPLGRLAVLGPMCMQYGHIIPTLEYVSDILTQVLNEI